MVDLFTPDLFGRHISDSTQRGASPGDPCCSRKRCQTKVKQPGVPVEVYHDIGWFDVAMDDTCLMGLIQPLAQLDGQVDGPPGIQLFLFNGVCAGTGKSF